jgi:hypothetical protein
MHLQNALAGETKLAEGLTLKLRFTLKIVSGVGSGYVQTDGIRNR